MNRKLVNALLLVTLATGSCSMFTSCKDTDDDFYNKVFSKDVELENQIKAAQVKLAELEAKFNDYYTKPEIDTKFTGIQKQIDDLKNVVIPGLEEKIGKLASQEDLETLEKNVQVVENKVNALDEIYKVYFQSIDTRLNQLITDINLSQTWNPMFGSINLPVGLSSTAAVNYYGESDHEVKFPGDPNYEVLRDENGESEAITAILALNPTQISVDGIYMNTNDEGKGSLGNLYLGINPTDIDITNVEFSLISSDNVAKIKELDLTPSSKKLMFGVSRSEETSNGFYETELLIDPETDAKNFKINVESGLKNAMMDALKNHTKSDFVTLAKLVYDQMQDITPAYAIKAEWETPSTTIDPDWEPEFNEDGTLKALPDVEMKKVAYVGKYEIAAATVRPLGYMFLHKENPNDSFTSAKLPTFGSIEEAVNNALKDLNINIDPEKVNFNGEGMEIVIDLSGIKVNGETPNPSKVTLKYDKNGGVTATGNDDALNPLVDQINKALKDVVAQINGSVQESIENIKNSLVGKASKFDNLVSKYNSLATRINNFLQDPNHYLQVAMAYQGTDGQLHQLSANKNFPTVFAKGTGAYQLYLTSYTAEIIAPSCNKYVAVTKGAAKDAINGSEGFNTVLPGNQQAVTLDASLLEAGDYEVVYSSLDYQGYTSTRTFYFTVK